MRLIPLFLTVAIWRQSLVGGMTSRPHILVSGGRRGCGGAFQGLPSRGEERRFGDRGACSAISRAAPSSSSQYLSPSLTFNYVADHPEEILEVLKRRAYVDGQGLWTRGGGNVTMALSSFAETNRVRRRLTAERNRLLGLRRALASSAAVHSPPQASDVSTTVSSSQTRPAEMKRTETTLRHRAEPPLRLSLQSERQTWPL
eukprot:GHVU01034753.1.p1 GENE.GHVU01034753.1~~GHVU01034753.1.p1  ORF type:complete len:201 (+),score=17.28 GHVU01034753.1:550-1152(+)